MIRTVPEQQDELDVQSVRKELYAWLLDGLSGSLQHQ